MKKLVVLIIICSTQLWGYAQEHQFLNKKENLVEFNVYRMDEYDALDSIGFLEKFPNGYYSIYNEDGLVIKANNYQSYVVDAETNHQNEYINFYLYDENNHRIGFIQQFTEGDEPFRIVALESISEDRKTIHFATATPSYQGHTVKFKETNYNPAQSALGDTIRITKTHHRAVGAFDSTVMLDIFYSNTTGLIDSTIYHNKCLGKLRAEKCQSKTVYFYNENGDLTCKRIEYHSNTSEVNPYQTRTVLFNENGLVESLETYYVDPELRTKKDVRKFVYTFREDN